MSDDKKAKAEAILRRVEEEMHLPAFDLDLHAVRLNGHAVDLVLRVDLIALLLVELLYLHHPYKKNFLIGTYLERSLYLKQI